MTLIACLRPANVPVLLADLLVSSSKPTGNKIVFPTLGELSLQRTDQSRLIPTSLVQKIHVISDRFIVAWAGRHIVARSVLKSLSEEFADSDPDQESLTRFFREFGTDDLKDSAFIGLTTDGTNISSFEIGAYTFDSDFFGHCHVTGSGAGRLLQKIEGGNSIDLIDGNVRDVDQAVSYALTTAAGFIGEELATGTPIEEHFGGGFEIACLTTGGAEKLNNVLFLFWIWDSRYEDRLPSMLPILIKADYVDGVLVVQRIGLKSNLEKSLTDDHSVICIHSPTESYQVMRTFRPPPPDLNARYLCNFYVGTNGADTGVSETTLYAASVESQIPLVIRLSEREISLHFDLDHFRREWGIVVPHLSEKLERAAEK